MQSRPKIERDNHQIHEVAVRIPYGKVFRLIAITLILQAAVTLAAAAYVGKTNAAQLVDMGTLLAIAVFICGALMWGRFPGADEPFVEHVDKDRSPQDMREMSITNMVRGAVLMISSVLYVLGCIGWNWVAGMIA
jgi:hypothetical protein